MNGALSRRSRRPELCLNTLADSIDISGQIEIAIVMGMRSNVEHMSLRRRAAVPSDAEALSALVRESFTGESSECWEPSAIQVLLAEASIDALRQKLAAPAFAAGMFFGRPAIGFILMQGPSVLDMLFVHPAHFRRGIGRQLWDEGRACIEERFPKTKTVELNATRFAVPFYRSVGFVPISAEFQRQGCRATRMACWLPARALGAECPLPPTPTSDGSLALPEDGDLLAGVVHQQPRT